MTDFHADRRQYKRIAFDAWGELSQGANVWPVRLVDLSLKGLLIERPSNWAAEPEEPFIIKIFLSDQADVMMEVQLRHDNDGHLGFACLHIDLESITYLRRLIELNLGDEDELQRELGSLIDS
ncbi:Cyclic diguanosine monophosphate-binding protein [compost metagenome]